MKKQLTLLAILVSLALTAGCAGTEPEITESVTETISSSTLPESLIDDQSSTPGDVSEIQSVDLTDDIVENSTDTDTDSKSSVETAADDLPDESSRTEEISSMKMKINGTPVSVEWENNDSTKALLQLVKDEPLTISMSMYGGFEQVGALGTELPRDDEQTTTSAGDIILYSGSSIVVFYGSNSWSYTRLGRITDSSPDELIELLGSGDVAVTLSLE